MTQHKRAENEIVELVRMSLRKQGYKIRTEVPNMGQSTDVVATRNRWVTAIEVKTKDWKGAISQCRAHGHVADFVCIAIGTVGISESLREQAAEKGIGIIHCPPNASECEWAVQPQRNKNVWRPERARFSRAIKAINHDD